LKVDPAVPGLSAVVDFTSALSQIRVKIGDNGGEAGNGRIYLQDEQILAVYAERPGIVASAIECVKQILGLIARDVDRGGGNLSAQTSQAWDHYRELLRILERELTEAMTVRLGGVSISQRDSILSNEDYKPPRFEIGQDSNVGNIGGGGQVGSP